MTPGDLAHLEAEDVAVQAKLRAPDALARAARWYANAGIAVFPLRPGAKTPALRKAHPEDQALQDACKRACGQDGHGLYDATTDVTRVEAWWKAQPQANIGIRTGLKVDVIDVDGPPGMWTYINQIVHGACPKREDGTTPSCCDDGTHCHGDGGTTMRALAGDVLAISKTAGDNGGLHLYIRPTGDTIGSNILPGIDYRGEGGYVVAPPSRGRLGIYVWQTPLTPDVLAAVA